MKLQSQLDPEDPPVVSVVNPEGRSSILLVCDHASRTLPKRYGCLGISEAEMRRHIGWDIGAADVMRHLAEMLDARGILAGYSRLLIDCNRRPDDPTLVCQVSDGTIIDGNRGLSEQEIAERIAMFHQPYHDRVASELTRMQKTIPVPALVSIHSFTPVMRGFERPWHIGILWTKDQRLAKPLMEGLAVDRSIVVGDNEPYSGHSNVGYTMARHGADAGLPHVLIEIRQDLIDTHHGASAWAGRLANVLKDIVAQQEPFQAKIY